MAKIEERRSNGSPARDAPGEVRKEEDGSKAGCEEDEEGGGMQLPSVALDHHSHDLAREIVLFVPLLLTKVIYINLSNVFITFF